MPPYLYDLEHRADGRGVEQVLVLRDMFHVARMRVILTVLVGHERLAADGAVVMQPVEEVLVEGLRERFAGAQGLRYEREGCHYVGDLQEGV